MAGAGKRGGDADDDAVAIDRHAEAGEVAGDAVEFRQNKQAGPGGQQDGQRTGEKLAAEKREGLAAGADGGVLG